MYKEKRTVWQGVILSQMFLKTMTYLVLQYQVSDCYPCANRVILFAF